MGCSAWPAVFSKTITGTWEVLIDGAINHVIWYQNRIGEMDTAPQTDPAELTFQWLVMQRINGRDLEAFQEKMEEANIQPAQVETEVEWRRQGGKPRRMAQLTPESPHGNCLIIPIMGNWESIRLLNTADTPRLLSDIESAVGLPADRSLSKPGETTFGRTGGDAGRMAFLQFDVYDIVLAENASKIGDVISEIDVEKRPDVNPSVFNRLEKWYRSPVAVCCFKSSQQAEAKPVGFAFQPTDPDQLVVYTLDGHDGYPPNPYQAVHLDHTIFVGSYRTPEEFTALVTYRDPVPRHLRPYLLDRVMGMPFDQQLMNGDFVFDIAAVRAGCFNGVRSMPRYSAVQYSGEERIFRNVPYNNGKRSLIEKK